MMKDRIGKIAVIMLWTVLLTVLLPGVRIPAGAAELPTEITVSNEEYADGSVDVLVTLDSNPGMMTLLITPVYDPTALRLESVENGVLFENMRVGDHILFDHFADTADTGLLMVMRFTVLDPDAAGVYAVDLTVREAFASDGTDRAAGATVYAGQIIVPCSHPDAELHPAVPPTCKEVGWTDGLFCPRCRKYVAGHEEIPKTEDHVWGAYSPLSDRDHERVCGVCQLPQASPHVWDEVTVVPPTADAQGYTEHRCSACGHSYRDNFTDLPAYLRGDVNGDGTVNRRDAIYLLYHVLLGSNRYPVNQPCDFNGDGAVNRRDAIYLLYHVLLPSRYPLS